MLLTAKHLNLYLLFSLSSFWAAKEDTCARSWSHSFLSSFSFSNRDINSLIKFCVVTAQARSIKSLKDVDFRKYVLAGTPFESTEIHSMRNSSMIRWLEMRDVATNRRHVTMKPSNQHEGTFTRTRKSYHYILIFFAPSKFVGRTWEFHLQVGRSDPQLRAQALSLHEGKRSTCNRSFLNRKSCVLPFYWGP